MDKCATCKWFSKDYSGGEYLGHGECRFAPPNVLQFADENSEACGRTMWPKVHEFDFCGAHVEKDS